MVLLRAVQEQAASEGHGEKARAETLCSRGSIEITITRAQSEDNDLGWERERGRGREGEGQFDTFNSIRRMPHVFWKLSRRSRVNCIHNDALSIAHMNDETRRDKSVWKTSFRLGIGHSISLMDPGVSKIGAPRGTHWKEIVPVE